MQQKSSPLTRRAFILLFGEPVEAAVALGDFQQFLLGILGQHIRIHSPAPVGHDSRGLIHPGLVAQTQHILDGQDADIRGAGTDVIKIHGVEKLHGANYSIIPDQIEAGTYMIAAAITGGDVLVKNIIPKHMDSLTAKLDEMNVKVAEWEDSIRVMADAPLKAVNVKTMAYPGFPTDIQSPFMAYLTTVEGASTVISEVRLIDG